MIDNQPTTEAPAHPTRKIPIHERSVRLGDVIVVNAYRVNRTLLKQRFAEGGYQAYETPHFLLFTREAEPYLLEMFNEPGIISVQTHCNVYLSLPAVQ